MNRAEGGSNAGSSSSHLNSGPNVDMSQNEIVNNADSPDQLISNNSRSMYLDIVYIWKLAFSKAQSFFDVFFGL